MSDPHRVAETRTRTRDAVGKGMLLHALSLGAESYYTYRVLPWEACLCEPPSAHVAARAVLALAKSLERLEIFAGHFIPTAATIPATAGCAGLPSRRVLPVERS